MKETMRVIDAKIERDAKDQEDKRFNMTAAKMAEQMHIDPSLFSRWRQTDDTSVKKDTLVSMIVGFSDDPAEQAELLAAYLTDQKRAVPASEMVSITTTKDNRVNEMPPAAYAEDRYSQLSQIARQLDLDEKLTGSLSALFKSLPNNPSLRRVLMGLAKMAD